MSLVDACQASPEDISNAYRRQSRLYHPDKHTDPVLKKEAEILFNRTKKAYEGLYTIESTIYGL